MYVRPLKYDRPAAQTILDMLNYTNGTAFEPWQLTFGIPEMVGKKRGEMVNPPHVHDYDVQRPMDNTLTKIDIYPTPESGWTGQRQLTYRRKIIQDHFVSVPMVIYAESPCKADILKALHEQRHLYLDDHLVEIESEVVDINDVIYATHMGSIVENNISCEDYIPPVTWNVTVKILPEHPFWMGELRVYVREAVKFLDRNIKTTIEIYKYLGPGDHDKMPAEVILPMNRYVDTDYLLKKLKVDDLVPAGIVDIAKLVTDDCWVFSNIPQVFNLYGAKVIYNGPNTGEVYIDDPKVSNVIIIQFSDSHCRNIAGQWIIGYYNRETWLRRARIDSYPLMDQ